MKKIITLILTLSCLLTLIIYCRTNNTGQVTLPDDIKKITIAWNGGPFTTFSYTDDAKINALADYLTSLQLASTQEDPAEYLGGGWQIIVQTDSETIEMWHCHNRFFQTPDGKWWSITYEQASALTTLLKENIPDEMPQTIIYDEWMLQDS